MVLTKLNAAKGGGYIVQSDHSRARATSPAERYEYVVNLVREYGSYPLQLGRVRPPGFEVDADLSDRTDS